VTGAAVNTDHVYKNGKELRCGYTTGSCATAAAKQAVRILLGLPVTEGIGIMTPKGKALQLPAEVLLKEKDRVRCGVIKDAGDDADVTDGLMVCAEVRFPERPEDGKGPEYEIDGGEGVGRVTRPGLDQPVGAAAINSVPRRMILEVLREAAEQAGYAGSLQVVISVPGGGEVAQRTFNPRLGIEGGISILGTSGIVEPMSEQALIDTIRAEISMRTAEGAEALLMTPGNYGESFIRERMGLELENCVKCSNFIGEAVDLAAGFGVKDILLIGHIGKLVKVGSGIMNTHSRCADGRMETLSSCVLLAGGDADTAREILRCNTTEDALLFLREKACYDKAMEILAERVETALSHHVYDRIRIGAVLFSMQSGLCLIGKKAEEMFEDGIFCRGRLGSA